MVNGLNVKITIKDNKTGDYVRIPVIPPRLQYQEGAAMVDTVKILNIGNIDFHNGVDLDTMGWSSFFPARYDGGYVNIAGDLLKDPLEYKEIFNEWKNTGQSLQLIIPVIDLNVPMYLASFNWDLRGYEKDIYYSCSFKRDKDVRPRQYNTDTGTIQEVDQKTPQDRQPVSEGYGNLGNVYTVKEGDTLTIVAKKYGKDWQTIYESNRGVIGDDPNNLEPGTKLLIGAPSYDY